MTAPIQHPLLAGLIARAATLPLARRTDPGTSKQAAASAGHAVSGEAMEVLHALVRCGGGTSRQIAGTDDAFRFTCAKRLVVLERAGLAERVTVITDPATGRKAEAWAATAAGAKAVLA